MSSMKSYCWIRTLALDVQATEPGARQVVQPCGTLRFFAGGRPPHTVASNAPLRAEGQDDCKDKPVQQTGGFKFWIAPENQFGRVQADFVFDYGPAFDSEPAANNWIFFTAEGRQWDKEASNRFLIGFGECSADKQPPNDTVAEIFDNREQTPDRLKFPEDAWSRDAKTAHLLRRTDLLLDTASIETLSCEKIRHELTHIELQALVQLQRKQRPIPKGLIGQQAQSMRHAIAPVLTAACLAGRLFETAAGQVLVAWVADTVDPVVFRNKRYFMRKRPGQLGDPALQSMFGDTGAGLDRLHPGHPSYPSGHATHAYVWAYLLQHCGVDADAVLGAASAVAVNREIAGLHFASDTAAGQSLAKEIVKRMVDAQHNPKYEDFVKQLAAIGLELSP